jgi:hypothetical protein
MHTPFSNIFFSPVTNSNSDLHLHALSNGLLQPLRSVIKRPRFLDGNNSPRETDFHPLQPSLQLFLSGNSLSSLPCDLFNLHNITVLSLRNNNLGFLSPHISNLRKLIELNIAGNGLRYLPWEFLDLVRGENLQSLTVLPNPLLRPFTSDGFLMDETPMPGQWEQPRSKAQLDAIVQRLEKNLADYYSEPNAPTAALEQTTWMLELCKGYAKACRAVVDGLLKKGFLVLGDDPGTLDDMWARYNEVDLDLHPTPMFIASTPITRFDGDGSLPRGERRNIPPSQLATTTEILPAIPGGAPATSRGTKVSSLFELAARSAARVTELPMLHTLLPEDAPRSVTQALQTACQAREEGGRLCSVCGQNYIIPRTEWIEYWHLPPKFGQRSSREEMFWPFLRRGCSLACVPSR